MTQTEGEANHLRDLVSMVERVRDYFAGEAPRADDTRAWLSYLLVLKAIQGKLNYDISFLACLLAKEYLSSRFDSLDWDVTATSHGAVGLDVNVVTVGGVRIVGTVRTIIPHLRHDFDASQMAALRRDVARLTAVEASLKYVFLTDRRAYELLSGPYAPALAGVEVVLLDPFETAA